MNPEPETAKMVNHLDIRNNLQPVKLAEGPCPNCKAILDIWLTGQGLELSELGRGYDVQARGRYGSAKNSGEDGCE